MSILTTLATLLPLPGIPVPSWFVQIIAKKLALEAKGYIEDPAHLIGLKQHVRDWLVQHLKDHQVSPELTADATEVLDAILGIAPASSVVVVSHGDDVQALPAKALTTPAPDTTVAQATAETVAVLAEAVAANP